MQAELDRLAHAMREVVELFYQPPEFPLSIDPLGNIAWPTDVAPEVLADWIAADGLDDWSEWASKVFLCNALATRLLSLPELGRSLEIAAAENPTRPVVCWSTQDGYPMRDYFTSYIAIVRAMAEAANLAAEGFMRLEAMASDGYPLFPSSFISEELPLRRLLNRVRLDWLDAGLQFEVGTMRVLLPRSTSDPEGDGLSDEAAHDSPKGVAYIDAALHITQGDETHAKDLVREWTKNKEFEGIKKLGKDPSYGKRPLAGSAEIAKKVAELVGLNPSERRSLSSHLKRLERLPSGPWRPPKTRK